MNPEYDFSKLYSETHVRPGYKSQQKSQEVNKVSKFPT